VKAVNYQLIEGNLYKLGVYGILQRCVLEHERHMILQKVHEGVAGYHYAGKETVENILLGMCYILCMCVCGCVRFDNCV
jgi:hypothetical protein